MMQLNTQEAKMQSNVEVFREIAAFKRETSAHVLVVFALAESERVVCSNCCDLATEMTEIANQGGLAIGLIAFKPVGNELEPCSRVLAKYRGDQDLEQYLQTVINRLRKDLEPHGVRVL